MSLDSSFPQAVQSEIIPFDDHREIVGENAEYHEITLLCRANALKESGEREAALLMYNKSILAGSVEAIIYRGFMQAEIALENGDKEMFLKASRDAVNVICKMMERTYVDRLHNLLVSAANIGLIDGTKQLGLMEVQPMEIYDRMVDFVRIQDDPISALENLFEYLDCFESNDMAEAS